MQAAPARDLAAVIKGAADKLDAAVRCHPNAVDTLIHEALEILDGDREPDAIRASHGQAPAGATLPDGWVPLTITHEGQYPEEVAYGPQIMMDRLGKWLGKYFAQAAQADSVQEDAARWNAWSQAMVEGANCDTEPEFLRVLSDAIGDAEPPITLQQLNAWTDAARAAQKEGE